MLRRRKHFFFIWNMNVAPACMHVLIGCLCLVSLICIAKQWSNSFDTDFQLKQKLDKKKTFNSNDKVLAIFQRIEHANHCLLRCGKTMAL